MQIPWKSSAHQSSEQLEGGERTAFRPEPAGPESSRLHLQPQHPGRGVDTGPCSARPGLTLEQHGSPLHSSTTTQAFSTRNYRATPPLVLRWLNLRCREPRAVSLTSDNDLKPSSGR
ncbi:uncharacterized protein ACBT57_021225 isoform 2-T2 [Dama dama]